MCYLKGRRQNEGIFIPDQKTRNFSKEGISSYANRKQRQTFGTQRLFQYTSYMQKKTYTEVYVL